MVSMKNISLVFLKRFDGLQKEEQELLLALYDPHQPEVMIIEQGNHDQGDVNDDFDDDGHEIGNSLK